MACAGELHLYRPAALIADDLLRMKATVALDRLGREPKVMFDDPSDIYGCIGCGSLYRHMPGDQPARLYANDSYTREELVAEWENGVEGLRADWAWLTRAGIDQSKRVLEVGCYAGSFLTYCRERGVASKGIDVGADVVTFCSELGLDVTRTTIDQLDEGDFDAIWILNCFDQVADPHTMLAACYDRLVRNGRLVVRTPTADFAHLAYSGVDPLPRVEAMANLLWGLPFLACYSRAGLIRLLTAHHFVVLDVLGRYVDGTRMHGSHRCGPWMDIVAARP